MPRLRFYPIARCQSVVFLRPLETRLHIPAARFARATATDVPREIRGRRESRVRDAPAASRANKKSARAVVTTGSPKQSGLPCAMVYGLFRALPGDRAVLPPSLRCLKRNLTPASGRQDHTALPSALMTLVSASPRRPSHPASTFVTIAKRPSYRGGTRESVELICPT